MYERATDHGDRNCTIKTDFMSPPPEGMLLFCHQNRMISFCIDLFSCSGAALLRSNIAQSGMLVFRVIPVYKGSKPSSGVLKGGKTIRISNGIFQGFIPGFNKGVVIADPRPGIASGYVKDIQNGHRYR